MDSQGWKSLGAALLKIALACTLAIGIPYGAYALYCSYAESGAFTPKNIAIQGNLRQSDDSIIETLGFAVDDANLAEMDVRAVEDAIETLPWVRSVNVKVKLPDTLRIDVTEYEPLGIVNDGSLTLIDTNGEFIKFWRDEDELTAPIVSLDKPLAERTSEAVRAFEIASLAHKLGYSKKIHEIQYDKGVGYTLYTDTTEIRIGFDRFEERLSRLLQVESLLESRRVVAQYILLDADDDLKRIAVKPASANVDSKPSQPSSHELPPAAKPGDPSTTDSNLRDDDKSPSNAPAENANGKNKPSAKEKQNTNLPAADKNAKPDVDKNAKPDVDENAKPDADENAKPDDDENAKPDDDENAKPDVDKNAKPDADENAKPDDDKNAKPDADENTGSATDTTRKVRPPDRAIPDDEDLALPPLFLEND